MKDQLISCTKKRERQRQRQFFSFRTDCRGPSVLVSTIQTVPPSWVSTTTFHAFQGVVWKSCRHPHFASILHILHIPSVGCIDGGLWPGGRPPKWPSFSLHVDLPLPLALPLFHQLGTLGTLDSRDIKVWPHLFVDRGDSRFDIPPLN